jgi:C4-dicarboxylate-specific signal transduction histidine kinase
MTLTAARDQDRDIGEQKRLEEGLHHSEKLAATGRLAAAIAHEINNPLESVTNLLYLLQNQCPLDDRTRQSTWPGKKSRASCTSPGRRWASTASRRCPVGIHISELLENVLELYGRRIHSRRIRVERCFRREPEIRVFPGEMRQVFSNLVVNALEAVGGDCEVKLHVFESRDWRRPERHGVRVVIADNGPGIPPEHRRHLFEPFYTTKGEGGTGLGLWLSRGIIHKYGGDIRVRYSVHPDHRGTVLSIFLPGQSRDQAAGAA